MIQAGDRRRGFRDFSFFERLIIIGIRRDTADTEYVLLRWREARAGALVRAPVSKVVLTTTIAAEVEATATVFLFLGKRQKLLAALLGSRRLFTRLGIRVDLGRFRIVGVADANTQGCPVKGCGVGGPHTKGLVKLFGQFDEAR